MDSILLGKVFIMQYLFGISLGVTSAFLILLVLVQRGRGGGLSGALGGMGGQSAFGTKAGDVFTKVTVGAALVWIFLAMGAVMLLNPADKFGDGKGDTSGASALGGSDEDDEGAGGTIDTTEGGDETDASTSTDTTESGDDPPKADSTDADDTDTPPPAEKVDGDTPDSDKPEADAGNDSAEEAAAKDTSKEKADDAGTSEKPADDPTADDTAADETPADEKPADDSDE